MKTQTIHIVFGYSGSGKDTIGEYICTKTDSVLVKFAAPGKRALEFMMRIPEGSLDDREFRMNIAPNCQGRTYLQVLIDFYKHKALVMGEDLFTQQTVQVILELLDQEEDVVITDLRSIDEYKAIVDLSSMVELKLYWVERRSARMLESDQAQELLYRHLKSIATSFTELDNNGTREQLYHKVTEVL